MSAQETPLHALAKLQEGEGYTWETALRIAAGQLSALTAAGLVVEQDWQPIATAPRDGTGIMLAHIGQQRVYIGEWWKGTASYDPCWLNRCADDTPDIATHWRPLPAPPAAQEPK